MDPNLRTALAIFLAVFLKTILFAWWDRFKERKALEPVPMKLRRGVYVPWGIVQRVQHYGWRATQIWMAYMAVLIIALIAMWVGLWDGF